MMKTLAIITGIVGIIYIFLSVRVMQGMRVCYQAYVPTQDEIAWNAVKYGWNKQTICQSRYDLYVSLGECLDSTHTMFDTRIVERVLPGAKMFLGLVMYGYKDIAVLQKEHDTQCQQYPMQMFEPPAY